MITTLYFNPNIVSYLETLMSKAVLKEEERVNREFASCLLITHRNMVFEVILEGVPIYLVKNKELWKHPVFTAYR